MKRRPSLVTFASLSLWLAACSTETRRSGGAETTTLPAPGDTPLVDQDAYDPVPSPDGSLIAFIRPHWGRHAPGGDQSKLDTEVMVMSATGQLLTPQPLADAFLAGWSSAGKVVCVRDGVGFLVGQDGAREHEVQLPFHAAGGTPQRAAWLASKNQLLLTHLGQHETELRLGDGRVLARHPSAPPVVGELIVPSPDERYLAVLDASFVTPVLRVFDQETQTWARFGSIVVYPQASAGHWDSLKPLWNPWFPDGSHLVFATATDIIAATPDGKNQAVLAHVDHAGLPTPSPDGQSVAFVTLELVPRRDSPGSNNVENSQVWVVKARPGSTPRALSQKSSEATVSLAWLDARQLLFDRVSWFLDDPRREIVQPGARIFKVAIPAETPAEAKTPEAK